MLIWHFRYESAQVISNYPLKVILCLNLMRSIRSSYNILVISLDLSYIQTDVHSNILVLVFGVFSRCNRISWQTVNGDCELVRSLVISLRVSVPYFTKKAPITYCRLSILGPYMRCYISYSPILLKILFKPFRRKNTRRTWNMP